jgi:hypothetical protein
MTKKRVKLYGTMVQGSGFNIIPDNEIEDGSIVCSEKPGFITSK